MIVGQNKKGRQHVFVNACVLVTQKELVVGEMICFWGDISYILVFLLEVTHLQSIYMYLTISVFMYLYTCGHICFFIHSSIWVIFFF